MEPKQIARQLAHYETFLRNLALDLHSTHQGAGDGLLLAVQIRRADGVLIASDGGYLPFGADEPTTLHVVEAACAQIDGRIARAMVMYAAINGARTPRGPYRDMLNVAIWSAEQRMKDEG